VTPQFFPAVTNDFLFLYPVLGMRGQDIDWPIRDEKMTKRPK